MSSESTSKCGQNQRISHAKSMTMISYCKNQHEIINVVTRDTADSQLFCFLNVQNEMSRGHVFRSNLLSTTREHNKHERNISCPPQTPLWDTWSVSWTSNAWTQEGMSVSTTNMKGTFLVPPKPPLETPEVSREHWKWVANIVYLSGYPPSGGTHDTFGVTSLHKGSWYA